MTSLIWAIVAVLVVLWLLGLIGGVGGNLIFLLLLLAIVGVLYNLLAGGIYRGAGHHQHATEVTEVEQHDV
ncbi:MAG: lmo0937 family membrane protein [Chloroflexi bacterium]|nr:MAG: lmo0937 family membrane protein [Chloroflexota bacterium]